jgi:hypothetical protein
MAHPINRTARTLMVYNLCVQHDCATRDNKPFHADGIDVTA